MSPYRGRVVEAIFFEAGDDAVAKVLERPVHEDGRSEFVWLRLSNGDLILGVFPCGDTYFEVESLVERDYKAAFDAR
jgi:hypothetical protein